jgi:hypothetical protein
MFGLRNIQEFISRLRTLRLMFQTEYEGRSPGLAASVGSLSFLPSVELLIQIWPTELDFESQLHSRKGFSPNLAMHSMIEAKFMSLVPELFYE